MSEFAPPTGPPPPKVPEGWKAVWNDQYKEWFYVNLHTKQSSWEKPTEPAPNPNSTHDEAPPSYIPGSTAPQVSDTKKPLDSNNPYNNSNTETDEQMARRLQAEEDARLRGGNSHSPLPGNADRGAADAYYGSGSGPGQTYQQQPPGLQGGYPGGPQASSSPYPQGQPQSSDKGLFSKLKTKLGGSAGGGRPPQGYGGYPQQAPYGGGYGGYPPQQPGYGGGYGGYPPQGMYGQPARRKAGMGAGGAAALGVGGGLVGGMLLADAMNDHDDHEYQEGYQDGQQDDGGYDDGGGDFGGGDF